MKLVDMFCGVGGFSAGAREFLIVFKGAGRL